MIFQASLKLSEYILGGSSELFLASIQKFSQKLQKFWMNFFYWK